MPWETSDRSLLADLSLARGDWDRDAERRSDTEAMAAAWADPRCRVLLVAQGRFTVKETGVPTAGAGSSLSGAGVGDAATPMLRFVAPSQVPANAERLYLGVDPSGAPVFAVRCLPAEPSSTEPSSGLREVGAELGADEVSIAAMAVALDNWHASHPRCSRCGEPTQIADGGWVRRCAADGSDHYPRTDPAVIVLVIDRDDRALLGRQGRWQATWFSTLAGFVESGESAEAAVRREILEESGVVVGEMAYLGSQPWPFPSSLMLGYHALAETTDIDVDGEEIVEARWFSREELRAACESGEVALPPAVSIARRLIERWYGEPLAGDWIRP